MSVRKISNSWWVDFRFNRIRYRKKSPDNSKAGAQAYEALLRQKLGRGEPLEPPQMKKIELPTFEDFAWKWFEIYAKANNKASEIRNKKIALRVHLIPFFKRTRIDKISSLQIENYKAQKVKTHLANKTINNQLTILAKCLCTAQEWLELDKIPKIKKLKVPPQKFDYLTPEESKVLLESAHGIFKDMIFLSLKTGVRKGELMSLRWEDINWQNRTITISRSVYMGVITSTKSNKERHIPLSDEASNMLFPKRKMTGYIFSDKDGKIFNRWRLNDTLDRIIKKSGLRRITWHILRHTFASHLAMAGATIQSIQQLLGHSDIQTTLRYAHLSPSILRNTVNLLDSKPVNNDFGQYMVNNVQKDTVNNAPVIAQNANMLPNINKKQLR